MKLEKFDYQIGHKRKTYSFVLLFVCVIALFVGAFIFKSFATYKVTNSYNIISGSIATFTRENQTLYYYLVDEEGGLLSTNAVPEKTDYTYDSVRSVCENASPLVYDEVNNTISITGENPDTCRAYFNIIPLASKTLTALGETTVKEGAPTFNSYNASEEGIYAAQDDYGTSYYYYGVNRKYFSMGGAIYNIIRINGDGSIRLLFNEVQSVNSFNELSNDNAYVGYYYGTAGSNTYQLTHANMNQSQSNQTLNFYYTEMVMNEYIVDTLFCNDRSMYNESYGTVANGDTVHGYGTDTTFYGSYYRITNNIPSLKCPNKSDAFTVNDIINGNGVLTNSIGALTADEIYMTGLSNISALAAGSMSPWKFENGNAYVYAKKINAGSDGVVINGGEYYTAPVINVKGNIPITGNGSLETPYTYSS